MIARANLLLVFMALANFALAAPAEKKLVIPDYPTAKDQYNFAEMYKGSQVLTGDAARRKQQMSKAAQCYQRVVDRFPEDVNFTPRAIVDLGDCAAQSQDYKVALTHYNRAISGYPDNEYVVARSMCAIGMIQDKREEHEAAKATYKDIIDRFSNSRSMAVRDLVKRASVLYFKVHEKKEKEGFSLKKLNPFSKK